MITSISQRKLAHTKILANCKGSSPNISCKVKQIYVIEALRQGVKYVQS